MATTEGPTHTHAHPGRIERLNGQAYRCCTRNEQCKSQQPMKKSKVTDKLCQCTNGRPPSRSIIQGELEPFVSRIRPAFVNLDQVPLGIYCQASFNNYQIIKSLIILTTQNDLKQHAHQKNHLHQGLSIAAHQTARSIKNFL